MSRKSPHVRLAPQLLGGGQEEGLRSGTLNVAGIVGLGKACELAQKNLSEEMQRLAQLRDRLSKYLTNALDEVQVNGHPTERLPGNLNLSISYVESETLLMRLGKDIAISAGSACATGSLETSHVLKAIGLKKDQAHTAIRFGLGRFNTAEEVDYVGERVVKEVKQLRALSPLYQAVK